jgi:hypothetical protein
MNMSMRVAHLDFSKRLPLFDAVGAVGVLIE